MAEFTLREVLQAVGGTAIDIPEETTFEDVLTDTRRDVTGALFVALVGDTFDGHDFLAEAIGKDARAVLVKKGGGYDRVPRIEVDDTLKAYQRLANAHRRKFHVPLVAVTGSSGKTTTKELIATVLSSKFNVLKTEKNFNNEIGLPATLLGLDETHEVCVVEMGMRGKGQIEELADIAEPTVAVVTNVGTSHIELLGSREAIAEAKAELVEAIDREGTVVLNEDDHFVKGMAALTSGKRIGYGMKSNATVTGYRLRYKKDGVKFTCKCYDEIFDVFLPMLGEYNVYNALAAVAVGRAFGMSGGKTAKALASFTGIPMRQEIVSLPDFVVVNDTYNANPQSTAESIKAIAQLEGKRKVAILGDMFELGELTEEAHRRIGRLLAEECYGAVYAVGDAGAYTCEAASEYGVPTVRHCATKEEAVQRYMAGRHVGDTVLVKGSRGMKMEEAVAMLLNKMKE